MEINYCNMKIRTINFSRNIVLIFAVIIWQSSLGTNAILLEGDNLGQNGYVKFSNGFLIQWGYSSSSSNATYIYLPTSFYNTNYCITITFIEPGNGMNIVSPLVTLKNTSNFRMRSRYAIGNANGTGEGTNPFGWIAIGRWK